MELNSLFWVTFVVIVAIGFAGAAYCHRINEDRSKDRVDET